MKMKKVVATAVISAMLLSVTACGAGGNAVAKGN